MGEYATLGNMVGGERLVWLVCHLGVHYAPSHSLLIVHEMEAVTFLGAQQPQRLHTVHSQKLPCLEHCQVDDTLARRVGRCAAKGGRGARNRTNPLST